MAVEYPFVYVERSRLERRSHEESACPHGSAAGYRPGHLGDRLAFQWNARTATSRSPDRTLVLYVASLLYAMPPQNRGSSQRLARGAPLESTWSVRGATKRMLINARFGQDSNGHYWRRSLLEMTRNETTSLGIRLGRRRLAVAAAAGLGLLGMMSGVAAAASSTTNTPSVAAAVGTVYQANLPCCDNVVLQAWPAPSAPILTTRAIPQGSYSVTGNAFLVIGPSDVADNCWLTTSNPSDTISGEGAATGNGASESGTGGAGVYANAVVNETVVVRAANDHLTLNCITKHFGQGTYAASATIIATKVPKIVGV
jgi:hypothetical protein